jgi:hypothetical protein
VQARPRALQRQTENRRSAPGGDDFAAAPEAPENIDIETCTGCGGATNTITGMDLKDE